MQRFELSPNDTIKLLTQEPFLIVRLPILKTQSPKHYETEKKEIL
jgi:hypothetical protein